MERGPSGVVGHLGFLLTLCTVMICITYTWDSLMFGKQMCSRGANVLIGGEV